MPSNFKALAAASGGEPTDANFKNVTLLLHGDGSNGAQNNTFIDSSTNNFTITRNGNTTQGSFSPYGSNWSNYFDGSGDYISAPSNAALDCGTGDFTIECWVYISTRTNSYPLVFGNNRGSWTTDALALTNSNADSGGIYADRFVFGWNNGGFSSVSYGTSQLLVANATNSNNTWYHFAVVRNGTSIKMYRNGVEVASATISSGASFNWGYNGALVGGGNWDGAASYFNGYISNLRLLKGTALYTAAFTPSTTPLTAITNTSLLTCAYNRFRDGSTNNFTITRNGDVKVTNFAPFAPSSAYSTTTNGGSAYFDGSGDYLLAPNNTALDVWDSGSGNFTVEAWIYPTVSMPNNCSVVGKAEMNGDPGWTAGWAFQAYNSKLNVNTAGDTRLFNSNTTDIPVGAWSHVVLVKSSSTVSIFQNGTRVATITNSSSYSNTSDQVHIGTDRNTAGSKFTGWMAGIRMVKGTAVYDPTQSTLTVPTSPPTAVTNTNLLLNATNAAIFDNSMKNDLETVGNAQISTSVKKFGTGSMAFDGSGDWVQTISTDLVAFGTGDFTIEMWAYPTSTLASMRLIEFIAAGDNVDLNVGGTGRISYYNGSSSTTSSTGVVSINAWNHIAVVRSSGTVKIYVNGTSQVTQATTPNSTARTLYIGGTTNNHFAGYIDDFRITKGVARYTANFTPPTAPFPNK